jgi:ribokinase
LIDEHERGHGGASYVTLARVQPDGPKLAVVGHVEWVQFARVAHVPRAGEVVHAVDPFEEPAGGGAVAAVQLARLAGAASGGGDALGVAAVALVTELGDDDHGRRSLLRLAQLGVDVRASLAAAATRRAVTLVDAEAERTITTFGPRLEPHGGDTQERWRALDGLDALYFTAGDEAELRLARARARVLVASPRAHDALGHGVRLDALVLSGDDEIELRAAARVLGEAELVVWTEGERGGSYRRSDGESGRLAPARVPGERVDSYGCGDSFAAGLTYGLGVGLPLADALALAARCGAVCATGRGPYERQLSRAEL